MPVFQTAWMYYLANPATAVNALALFYAVAGSWLWVATQLRSARANAHLSTSPAVATPSDLEAATQRINRVFYAVGGVCMTLALLLSVISSRF
ncbi:MAG TPA: hypothetical protein ENI17_01505 [Pseudomonas xinjiangensis]|uniref:Uncharacterized protein n=2 Tax=root TaxID=1 RepID=A0A7V1BQH8_9GAMM|nr:hypothetical protein [Halopseudomonas xinjiangensis]HEC46294.1 hypothetical protein [Halopseudomonas xinjiangensis]